MKSLKTLIILVTLVFSGLSQSYVGGWEGKVTDFPSALKLNFYWYSNPVDEEGVAGERVFEGVSLCTAVKIHERAYLTAAHCVLSEEKHTLGALSLSQAPFEASDALGEFIRPQRIYVSRDFVGCSKSLNPLWIFDCMDLALIEVVQENRSIPVSELAPFSLKKRADVVVGGYGTTTFHEYILTEPFKEYPTHLRYDERKVDKVKKQTFTLRSKRSGLNIDADWEAMAAAYEKADGKKRNIRKLQKESEDLHKYGQLAPGDSGGPAWSSYLNRNYVVGINSLYRMKLPGYDMFRRANNIEYIVRVDAGSTGHVWTQNIIKEIESGEAGQSGFIVR